MRKLLVVILTCLSAFAIQAQTYGNEWINYSQQYFKIPVFKEGIYRIDSATLAKYYNLSTFDPRNFQVFLKGKEQFIYVNGEADGKVNSGDYLEFYASSRMGDVDSMLYTNIKYVPNPYLPIYNDTIYVFLTSNNSLSNKRFTPETDVNFGAYPAADHVYSEKVFAQYGANVWYNPVYEYANGSSNPNLTQAEGKGVYIGKGYNFPINFTGLNTYTSSPKDFYVSVNYSGHSISTQTSPDHYIQTLYSSLNPSPIQLEDTAFYGYAPIRQTFTLNSQNIGNSITFTILSVNVPSLSAVSNFFMLHYINITYPQTLDLNNQSFAKLFIDNSSSTSKSTFDFSNFNFGTSNSVILLDLTNGRRISTVIAPPLVRAVIPNSTDKTTCILAAEGDTIAVTKLIKVNQTGYFTNFKKPVNKKPFVIIYHNSLQASAIDYKDYRQSIAGGSNDVVMADVAELYEQFSFGVNKHPVSIRNFARFLKDSLTHSPGYIFLIGKGVNYSSFFTANSHFANLVPTMGVPSSDNLLTSALSATNSNNFFPEIPIGRLSAFTNSEVAIYLSKIKQHESSEPADWKKRILHFVGGNDEQLLKTLSNYMSAYEQVIKDTLFGGDVYTFKKNTVAPIQTNVSDSIKNIISSGAALINFFGHGSEQGFDQAIDDPEVYNNTGKYPFVIANSCYSGDIHVPTRRSVSERFVFSNQKGSVGFLAATSYGFDHALNNYTSRFYTSLARTHYNEGVGDMIKEAAFYSSNSGDILTKLIGLDMTLHGDPSVRITNGATPDYQIKNSDIAFDLKKYVDSVGININYKNLGKAVKDSFFVRIERFFPNGDSANVLMRTVAPLFKEKLEYYMPLDFNRGIGLNRFTVSIDYVNEIHESAETNNTTIGTVDLFIPGGDLMPVYPYNYAVVPLTPSITLKASTTDPFAPSTTYRFELDTCDKFTNPISTTLITSKGGVLEWNVNLFAGDSTVYFWRVSRDSTGPNMRYIWKESSFQTINTRRGWGQAHFNQFKNDNYRFVTYKKEERRFLFQNNKHALFCRNAMEPVLEFSNINYFFNNVKMSDWGCAPGGWNIAVFDYASGEPDSPKLTTPSAPGPGVFNECVCVPEKLFYHSFSPASYCSASVPNWKADLENFINSIPANSHILAYTIGSLGTPGYAQITTFPNSLYSAFESFGAKTIRTTSDTVPYILFGRKGMTAGQGNEVKGTNKQSIITLNDSIESNWHSGYIASEKIGPSLKWNSLHWRVESLDNTPGDTTTLKLVGIRANGQIDTLQAFPEDSSDVLSLFNYADAKVYPYLKLVAFMKDNVHRTSPQLKRWQVLYDEAPECAINPLKGFASVNDTLAEGDDVTLRFPIENIGARNFEDSLVITYWIENNERNKFPLPQKMKSKPFLPGQVFIDTVKINSYQFTGNNSLWIYVNPVQNPKYQAEQFQFNNIGRYTFKVNKDITNPLLDVTFDGVRILNGDIVSAKPNILITLKDENKFLALNDTGAFTILLQRPDQSAQQRIYFGQELQFTPANLPKNSCSIQYRPTLPVDGKYMLIVQAKDRSRNASGAQDYRVEFEINNKPTVTNVLNYPNPFTTNTKFVFTLTGSEVPEVFTIQIMTITGKIVKEITRSELGNLHIGRNITDYSWDGRDNYGDRLANGVYLYRVVTKLNGENIEKNGSGADRFFVKDFGKMVLMR